MKAPCIRHLGPVLSWESAESHHPASLPSSVSVSLTYTMQLISVVDHTPQPCHSTSQDTGRVGVGVGKSHDGGRGCRFFTLLSCCHVAKLK
jgi:hypothetical protein